MTEPTAIAELLGIRLKPEQPLTLVDTLETGLKLRSLDLLARACAPADRDFDTLFVPKATLARRKRDHARLSREESLRVYRMARVWLHALKIWKTPESARTFLERPHMMLQGRRPRDVAIATDLGCELVDQILGGLEYGTAA
jgi:putative toxin-antitoxin system antitoxin component (TIGR02293 family)